jgi:hypothetical protein
MLALLGAVAAGADECAPWPGEPDPLPTLDDPKRLQILDFPALEPPVREWAWETDAAVARSEEEMEAVDVP